MKSATCDNQSKCSTVQRLDSWLWASRFFRSRKLANEAVVGGNVWLNGKRCKPARPVKPGDELRIRRASQEFIVIITELSVRRLGAKPAAELYRETESSKAAREQRDALMKAERLGLRLDRKRPGKRDREKMLRIKHQTPEWE